MTAPRIDVSVSAGDHAFLVFPIPFEYANQDITWQAFVQSAGVPDPDTPAVVNKTISHGVEVLSPPTQFAVELFEWDTIELLRNYYHEGTAIDHDGNRVTMVCGVLTVTATENR